MPYQMPSLQCKMDFVSTAFIWHERWCIHLIRFERNCSYKDKNAPANNFHHFCTEYKNLWESVVHNKPKQITSKKQKHSAKYFLTILINKITKIFRYQYLAISYTFTCNIKKYSKDICTFILFFPHSKLSYGFRRLMLRLMLSHME